MHRPHIILKLIFQPLMHRPHVILKLIFRKCYGYVVWLSPLKAEFEKKLPIMMPGAAVSFHWPRTDLDQLLSLRVEDISSCQWSGGFPLHKDHSFHIHMRCGLLYHVKIFLCGKISILKILEHFCIFIFLAEGRQVTLSLSGAT